jgi:hypothetical protein
VYVWSSWQQSSHCFLWSLVLTRLLSSLQKTVLLEGTAHSMCTAQTLLPFPDVVPETGRVESRSLVELNVPLLPQTEEFAMRIVR